MTLQMKSIRCIELICVTLQSHDVYINFMNSFKTELIELLKSSKHQIIQTNCIRCLTLLAYQMEDLS